MSDEMFVGAVLGGGVVIYAIVMCIYYIVLVIANWKIFTKADVPGWKSIVPVYNLYVQYKITWKTSYFWIMLVLSIFLGIFNSVLENSDNILLGLLALIVIIMYAVITIKSYHKLSVAFGHGVLFTLGLIFFNPIFELILGFGSSKYVGNSQS